MLRFWHDSIIVRSDSTGFFDLETARSNALLQCFNGLWPGLTGCQSVVKKIENDYQSQHHAWQ